ncbi:MAG: hypothetical protein WC586_09655 [Methanoregula sp.]
MPDFRQRPGTRKTYRRLKNPIADIAAFDAVLRTLIFDNPLGCTSYNARRKHFPPVQKVREIYTAKFEYRNESRKRVGTTIETYDSLEGYETGIAAVISNMANIFSHRGRVKHIPAADLFSVMLRCHDPGDGLYFIHLARNRITLSSYNNDGIKEKFEHWAATVPELV